MKQLSDELQMEQPFATEFPGTFTLRLDEDIIINISEIGNGGISLTSTLGPFPNEQLETFFTQAMLANLFGQGTKGAILGLNADGSQLTLSRNILYHTGYKDFRDNLEDFINMVDFWRAEALGQKELKKT